MLIAFGSNLICDPDSIGRISKGKELTFCTITFHHESTARMLISKKTIEFNGKKLKLLEFEGSNAKESTRKNSNTEKKKFQQVNKAVSETKTFQTNRILDCQTCKDKINISKCTCISSPSTLGISPKIRDQIGTSCNFSPSLSFSPNLNSTMFSTQTIVPNSNKLSKLNLLQCLKSANQITSKQLFADVSFKAYMTLSNPLVPQNHFIVDNAMQNKDVKTWIHDKFRAHSDIVSENHHTFNLRFNLKK